MSETVEEAKNMIISLFLCYAELYLFIFFQRLKADFLESFCGILENTNLSFCTVSAVMSDLEVRFTQYEAIQTTTHHFAFSFAVDRSDQGDPDFPTEIFQAAIFLFS